jgi:hypothetical protein
MKASEHFFHAADHLESQAKEMTRMAFVLRGLASQLSEEDCRIADAEKIMRAQEIKDAAPGKLDKLRMFLNDLDSMGGLGGQVHDQIRRLLEETK